MRRLLMGSRVSSLGGCDSCPYDESPAAAAASGVTLGDSSKTPRLCDGVGADELLADRVQDEAGDVADAEAFHERAAMRLDGLHAQAEREGDFLGAVAFGDELQDLALPRREVPDRRLG